MVGERQTAHLSDGEWSLSRASKGKACLTGFWSDKLNPMFLWHVSCTYYVMSLLHWCFVIKYWCQLFWLCLFHNTTLIIIHLCHLKYVCWMNVSIYHFQNCYAWQLTLKGFAIILNISCLTSCLTIACLLRLCHTCHHESEIWISYHSPATWQEVLLISTATWVTIMKKKKGFNLLLYLNVWLV